jgi:hypothetical protein
MSAYRLVGAILVIGAFALTPFAADVSATDADVRFRARQSERSAGLEEQLGQFVTSWPASAWPFTKVTLNGRLHVLNPPAET